MCLRQKRVSSQVNFGLLKSEVKQESADGKKMSKLVVIIDNIAFMSQKIPDVVTEEVTEEVAA
jgi:hypothetical protein